MGDNKCSFPEHSQIEAKIFCPECKIFMCNKCEKPHQAIFNYHQLIKIDENFQTTFTGFCKEFKHKEELKYFCKTHNLLCCAKCITRIKDEENGQHNNCEICLIKEIEQEKKGKLRENIKLLENLTVKLKDSIDELKNLYESEIGKKENLKTEISKIFTKFRNILNEREDQLLIKIDNQFNNLFFKEDLIKEAEKLPKKVKTSLEFGKSLDGEWNNNKLNYLINNCLNIENNIKEINLINETLTKSKSQNFHLKFIPKEQEINDFLEKYIINFGEIINQNQKYSFQKCPENIKNNKDYIVTGDNNNIIKKVNGDGWVCIICDEELDKTIENYIWKMRIISSNNYNPLFGVPNNDFDINSCTIDSEYNKGWFYCGYDGFLYSGPPHKYNSKI